MEIIELQNKIKLSRYRWILKIDDVIQFILYTKKEFNEIDPKCLKIVIDCFVSDGIEIENAGKEAIKWMNMWCNTCEHGFDDHDNGCPLCGEQTAVHMVEDTVWIGNGMRRRGVSPKKDIQLYTIDQLGVTVDLWDIKGAQIEKIIFYDDNSNNVQLDISADLISHTFNLYENY
jgi:hypothetical protein